MKVCFALTNILENDNVFFTYVPNILEDEKHSKKETY